MVRKTMGILGWSLLNCRAARNPLRTGIVISVTMTSGWCAAAASRSAAPSSTEANISNSAPNNVWRACRKARSSSASTILGFPIYFGSLGGGGGASSSVRVRTSCNDSVLHLCSDKATSKLTGFRNRTSQKARGNRESPYTIPWFTA